MNISNKRFEIALSVPRTNRSRFSRANKIVSHLICISIKNGESRAVEQMVDAFVVYVEITECGGGAADSLLTQIC